MSVTMDTPAAGIVPAGTGVHDGMRIRGRAGERGW